MSLIDDIKAEALCLGFSLTGITNLDPPNHGPVFRNWLERGYHAGMAYLAAQVKLEIRLAPKQAFPTFRSVLSLGMPYPKPDPSLMIKSGRGRVAAYAWGRDYHLVIPERLRILKERIQQICGHSITILAYTDSGPLLERDLAQRAGLGWIGKNTCLIHPRQGSYTFLAELLLELELETDPPFTADRCGTCQRCIQACPTGCILPDRTIDASRCISYLTIENKGSIPVELRPLLGDWIFGCDVCQMVCPWNQRAQPAAADPVFLPDPAGASPVLVDFLALTPAQFRSKFRNSPFLRAKRRGFLRNTCVAMGNQPDPAFIPALAGVLASETEPLVRAHAAWALRQIGSPQAVVLCDLHRSRETDPLVLAELK